MTSYATYYTKFQQLQQGIISFKEWKEFTDQVFDEILEENKEIFARFQNEWAE